jgi:hypothetical protein
MKSTQNRQMVTWSGILTLVVVLVFLFVAQFSSEPNQLAGATAVLAVIAAAAVGIERLIEGGWTVVSQLKNAWWPFNEMHTQIEGLVGDLDNQLKPVYTGAKTAIDALQGLSVDEIAKAKKEVDDLAKRLEDLKTLAPNNQRVNLIAACALQNIALLEQKYPKISNDVRIANQAVAGLSDFAASFRENPGRRLISIYVGSILGMIVAWAVGLDVFRAIFQDPAVVTAAGDAATKGTPLFPYVGVALTGLLIGLGSNPTHEVISVLQEIKKQRSLQNQPGPEIVGADGGSIAGFAGASVGNVPPMRRFR